MHGKLYRDAVAILNLAEWHALERVDEKQRHAVQLAQLLVKPGPNEMVHAANRHATGLRTLLGMAFDEARAVVDRYREFDANIP